MKPNPQTRMRALMTLIALALLSGGCGTTKTSQLERVAKDWCLTIRASQVIPVYPLTEDIQPGDVFLVQVPIGRQQEIYQEEGFLPLDNHLARLNPGGYASFYANSFLFGTNAVLPHDWIRPDSSVSNSWQPAPSAAFPSYSFSVRRGAGINLAVPVQGVPVGLSLLNSDAADGTVTIKEARTLGVDIISLFNELQSWAAAHRDFLKSYGASGDNGGTNYLRVVSRVYATGRMDVSLRDTSGQSGGMDVGAAKPVDLLFPDVPTGRTNVADTTAQNYTNALGVLNRGLLQSLAKDAAGNLLPGGSVRVTAAGSRTIAMQEDFLVPLAIGYLGFDCAIGSDGMPGEPIPTYAHLNAKFAVQRARLQLFNNTLKQQIAAFTEIKARYENATDDRKRQIRDLAMQEKLNSNTDDPEWITKLGLLVDGNDPGKLARFESLLQQIQNLD